MKTLFNALFLLLVGFSLSNCSRNDEENIVTEVKIINGTFDSLFLAITSKDGSVLRLNKNLMNRQFSVAGRPTGLAKKEELVLKVEKNDTLLFLGHYGPGTADQPTSYSIFTWPMVDTAIPVIPNHIIDFHLKPSKWVGFNLKAPIVDYIKQADIELTHSNGQKSTIALSVDEQKVGNERVSFRKGFDGNIGYLQTSWITAQVP